jgi:hypothetical protein
MRQAWQRDRRGGTDTPVTTYPGDQQGVAAQFGPRLVVVGTAEGGMK